MTDGTRILVVDDESLVCEMLKGMLEESGYLFAGRASNGQQAIEMTQSLQPDAVLMDVDMPGMDGIQAAEQILNCCPTPVIILTAYDTPQLVERARNAGVSAYLAKLPNARDLSRTIDIALARFEDVLELRRLNAELATRNQEMEQVLSNLQETQRFLVQSEARLQHLLNHSPSVIFSAKSPRDVPGGPQFTYVSRNVEQVLGHEPADFYQEPAFWWEHLHPEDVPFMRETRSQVIDEGHIEIEYRFRHKDGSYRWLHDQVQIVHDSTGSRSEMVGSWFDVTDRVRAEQALAQSQKMEAIGHLATGIAHDFNNLLTSILGTTEMIQMELKETDPLQRKLNRIMHSGEKAAYLVSQMLAFSRKQLAVPRRLDTNERLASMQKKLRHAAGDHITLVLETGPDVWPIDIDPSQLEQTLSSLLAHAGDSMSDAGTITIRTSNVSLKREEIAQELNLADGDYVRISLTDTGPGLSPEAQDHIFEPFYFRSDLVADGVGLRLAAVYGIVKQNEGYIWVNSREGQGTTFHIYLPRAE